MIKKWLVLLLLISNFSLRAQNYWVPDSSFRNLLKSRFSSCFTASDSLITNCSIIQNINLLNVSGNNLTDITGIEKFTGLKSLIAKNNFISNIALFPDGLTYLDLSQNLFTTIGPLPDSLRTLLINNNQISSIFPLPVSLRVLNCSYNQLTTLNFLSPFLTNFNCSHNLLSSVGAFPNSILTLDLSNNQFNNLTSFPLLVQSLDISNNLLSSIPLLPNSLSSFNCSVNLLTSLPPLPINLSHLYCRQNFLTSLPALPTAITTLNCNVNQLVSLPILTNALNEIYCDSNLLSSIPQLPSYLNRLYCSHNLLVNIPVLNTYLIFLDCSYNLITNLPVLNQFLYLLKCDHNSITTLPSFTLDLASVDCSNNPISCVPFIRNPNFFTLFYDSTFISCIPFTNTLVAFFPSAIPFCPITQTTCDYSFTTGFVFTDTNGNGIMDTLEKGRSLTISYYGNNTIESDTNGHFLAMSDSGNVNFQLNAPPYYLNSTPSAQIAQAGIDTLYFGLEPIPNITDLDIDLTNINFLRPGFLVNFIINAENKGTTSPSNVSIKYLKPAMLSTISANPPANQVSGDTLIWYLGTFSPFQIATISVIDSVSSAAIIGTITNAEAWIEPLQTDTNPSNNYKEIHQLISGSFDPNEKTVSPETVASNPTNYFEYIIRFQNTGTDTAFSVFITDTLSSLLDVSSIEMISTSHPCTFWVERGVAKWYFGHILLPDSNVNELASHGYLKFKIKLKSNLGVGNSIPNSANIYFDYNSAVITNTATINVSTLKVTDYKMNEIAIFPNPVHEMVYLKNKNYNPLGEIKLFNSDGKLVAIKTISSSSCAWQIIQLPTGVYYFKGENWEVKILKN